MSSLGKLQLDEQTDLTFGLDVFGTTEQAKDVRFVIEGKQFDISIKCAVANGNITATVPKLKGILEAASYDVRLEVLVGDKIFVPMRESVELNPLVEFDITKKNIKAVQEGVKVSIKKTVVSEETQKSTKHNLIEQAIKEGFDVAEMNGFSVIKTTDGKYAGLISDTRIIKASEPYDTLNGLVEELSK